MGMGRLRSITEAMMDAGYPPELPAAIVSRATHTEERRLYSTLAQLHSHALEQGLKAPAVIIVGQVCAQRTGQEHPSKVKRA